MGVFHESQGPENYFRRISGGEISGVIKIPIREWDMQNTATIALQFATRNIKIADLDPEVVVGIFDDSNNMYSGGTIQVAMNITLNTIQLTRPIGFFDSTIFSSISVNRGNINVKRGV